jgi:hypothetical protein
MAVAVVAVAGSAICEVVRAELAAEAPAAAAVPFRGLVNSIGAAPLAQRIPVAVAVARQALQLVPLVDLELPLFVISAHQIRQHSRHLL